ncbi:uncharacterized protein LOC122953907 [Acropora millepora]|uniref:uncharacterized protein LOC122953907 n=1 Tax=Acropora millepora TaxID=45264 RepID=UPI001CF3433D|nr:uncharacterized protein LOC122953907 [Acropora millepora]
MERVQISVALKKEQTKTIFLPHCTWDKFGDILANSGGRSLGLFDELTAFFSTMNMYSSVKMQISDTREYQDFLQMYTGKSKSRETITGNANFRMNQTSFTMLGFTQPQTAMPVIEDTQNNAKGFTSRILWFFAQPIFCCMQDTHLTAEETTTLQTFREELVEFLAEQYIEGEETYTIEEGEKVVSVIVDRTMYSLSPEAMELFERIHDAWELDICEKYPHDVLIGGLYSRGKAHLLRMSVSMHLLLKFWATCPMNNNATVQQDSSQTSVTNNGNAAALSQTTGESTSQAENNATDVDDAAQTVSIGPQAIAIAHSIVNTALTQLCLLTKKKFIINGTQEENENDNGEQQHHNNFILLRYTELSRKSSKPLSPKQTRSLQKDH